MSTPLSMETILEMLRGLSLNNRQWLAEHLVDPEELDSAIQRERDESFVRELHALRYDGEPTAEERKKMLHESHRFDLRKINYKYADE